MKEGTEDTEEVFVSLEEVMADMVAESVEEVCTEAMRDIRI